MASVVWNIGRIGRRWVGNELRQRVDLLPEKFEVIDGELLWTDEERLAMLAVMLEQVGVDQAVRLGDPAVWRAAVAGLG